MNKPSKILLNLNQSTVKGAWEVYVDDEKKQFGGIHFQTCKTM